MAAVVGVVVAAVVEVGVVGVVVVDATGAGVGFVGDGDE
jgi:hypothetical protein